VEKRCKAMSQRQPHFLQMFYIVRCVDLAQAQIRLLLDEREVPLSRDGRTSFLVVSEKSIVLSWGS
jgi:hypothetical protein